jgi:aspartyl-tRNA(Asn)/glutamyl-tRNA(Gln) amidotransferase subunit A
MARTVEDVAILLQSIAGHDPLDPASSPEPVPDFRAELEGGVAGMRLGVAEAWLQEFGTIDPEVLAAFEAALAVLESAGATIVDIEAAPLLAGRAATTVIITAEAYATYESTLIDHPELLGRSVRKSFHPGAFVSAADYLAAQRARSILRSQVQAILDHVDAIVSPTCPRPAARLDVIDFDARFQEPSFVNPYNLLGLPAISVPCGFSGAGLPIGLQVAAGPFEEPLVLRIARAYEQATPWHTDHPTLG